MDDFPTTGGEPAHLTVTIDWDALRTALGTGTLNYGQQISAAEARRLACDCKLIPVVLGTNSEPLDVGRATRTAPLGIRRALIARDRDCSPSPTKYTDHPSNTASNGGAGSGNRNLLTGWKDTGAVPGRGNIEAEDFAVPVGVHPVAISACTATTRPSSRTLTVSASTHTKG